MKFSLRAIPAGVLAAAVLFTGAAHAGEADIAYRQAVMKAVGGHMTAMSKMLKDGVGDMKNITVHADGMAALAKVAAGVFPAGSGPEAGKTEATAKVWSDKDGFAKVSAAFIEEANALAAAAKTGDKGAIGKALGALGKNGCKACHDGYREKKS